MDQLRMPIYSAALALTLASSAASAGAKDNGAELAQVIIERRSVIRITPHVEQPRIRPNFREWREKSAPKCFPLGAFAGIIISKPDSIDMVLRGGQLIRAKLEKGCPSIDFYSGFYVRPTADGRLCEDRDTIHSRTGGACEIDRFRVLAPPRR